MIDAKISLADAQQIPRVVGKKGYAGDSTIEVFPAKHLQLECGSSSHQRWFWIGETKDLLQIALGTESSHKSYCDMFNAEGIKICFDNSLERPRILAVRTGGSRTPLFASHKNGTITLSWKYENAVKGALSLTPDKALCRKFINKGHLRYRETIFEEISCVWPGESIVFDGNQILILQAPHQPVAQSGSLSLGADVTHAFKALICEASYSAISCAETPLLELSGGFDSSCVALSVAPMHKNWASYSVIQLGPAGHQQRTRRKELLTLIKTRDFEMNYSDVPGPIAALNIRENQTLLLDDNHRASCTYGIDNHWAGTFDVVVTGIGGDELCEEVSTDEPDDEIRGSISNSAAAAAMGRSDMFMRRGIWPVHPMSNQKVVDFCRTLPNCMRKGRALNTHMLARTGLSDGFIFPPYIEDCGSKLINDLLMFDIEKEFSDSLIADFGILDLSYQIRQFHKKMSTSFDIKSIYQYWALYKIEKVLRTYLV